MFCFVCNKSGHTTFSCVKPVTENTLVATIKVNSIRNEILRTELRIGTLNAKLYKFTTKYEINFIQDTKTKLQHRIDVLKNILPGAEKELQLSSIMHSIDDDDTDVCCVDNYTTANLKLIRIRRLSDEILRVETLIARLDTEIPNVSYREEIHYNNTSLHANSRRVKNLRVRLLKAELLVTKLDNCRITLYARFQCNNATNICPMDCTMDCIPSKQPEIKIKTEPFKTEPFKTEPFKTEPFKTEPFKTEPFGVPFGAASKQPEIKIKTEPFGVPFGAASKQPEIKIKTEPFQQHRFQQHRFQQYRMAPSTW
jgi:hypothetical protein